MEVKRGRGRPRTRFYFSDIEEEAMARYLATEDINERNAIYNECLRYALDKLVECILGFLAKNRGGQREILGTETYDFIHKDTLGHLTSVEHKFEQGRIGKNGTVTKAFSYYGTICKNYVLGLIIARGKALKKAYDYDNFMIGVDKNTSLSYEMDHVHYEPSELITEAKKEIENELTKNHEMHGIYLTENEEKVGIALIYILDNWQNLIDVETSNKFYKTILLSHLRELTLLQSKDIRLSLVRFKGIYKAMIDKRISCGLM